MEKPQRLSSLKETEHYKALIENDLLYQKKDGELGISVNGQAAAIKR